MSTNQERPPSPLLLRSFWFQGVLLLTALMEITSGLWQFDIEIHCIIDRLGARSFDYVRTGLNKNLGFTPEDREENIRRVAEVNIFLALELR